MERKIIFAPGEFYHVYVRGVDKRDLFRTGRDRERLQTLLYVANAKNVIHLSDLWYKQPDEVFALDRGVTLVDVGAYCFMPNHIHLLLHEKQERGISTFMLKLMTAYSMYFNKKHSRTGSLFERPFKAKHIDDDEYLRYLFAYIHLNPVKIKDPDAWAGKKIPHPKKAAEFLNTYKPSSYLDYCGVGRPCSKIISRKSFPDYFGQPQNFQSFINDWLSISEE